MSNLSEFVEFMLQSVYRPIAFPSLCVEEAFRRTVADIQYHYPGMHCIEITERIQSNKSELGVFLFRLGRVLYEQGEETLLNQMHALLKRFCGCELFFNTEIDVGFYIVHGEGTVIGSRNKIGKGFKIHQGCTIGEKRPLLGTTVKTVNCTIGDDVVMFANSSIIGPLNVGNRVVVGAHVLISRDLADDSVVLADVKTSVKQRKT